MGKPSGTMRKVVRTLSAGKPSALPVKASVAMPSWIVGWKRYSLRIVVSAGTDTSADAAPPASDRLACSVTETARVARFAGVVGDGERDVDLVAGRHFQRRARLHRERQSRREDLRGRAEPAIQRVRERRHLEGAERIAQIE